MYKILLTILVVIVVGIALHASCTSKDEGFKSVNVEEFSKLIADTAGVQLLDVRTPEEYAQGHIPGARLINMKDSSFMEQAESQLVKDKPVAVYCRSGRRSASAARSLVKAGYEVINLSGGITAWKSAKQIIMK